MHHTHAIQEEGVVDQESLRVEHILYHIGEFVYLSRATGPQIMFIERIWRDVTLNKLFVFGRCFYQPFEIGKLFGRKFLEKV